MCFLFAEENSNTLKIKQTIQALEFCYDAKYVNITLDLLIDNYSENKQSLNIIHKGKVNFVNTSGNLFSKSTTSEGLSASGNNIPEDVIYEVYKNRIDSKDNSFFFKERNNYLSLKNKHTEILKIFDASNNLEEFALPDDVDVPPFTAYTINNLPKGISLSRVKMEMKNDSYMYYIGTLPRFYIEGPKEVENRLINREDYSWSPNYEVFEEKLKANIIYPSFYDILIFQRGVGEVDSKINCEVLTPLLHFVPITNDTLLGDLVDVYTSESKSFKMDTQYESVHKLIYS